MIQEFCFSWKGRRWHGYFNAIANEKIIAHFEDAHICETIGFTLAYSKGESGAVSFPIDAEVLLTHEGIYEAIQKGMEVRLGKPLQHYLN